VDRSPKTAHCLGTVGQIVGHSSTARVSLPRPTQEESSPTRARRGPRSRTSAAPLCLMSRSWRRALGRGSGASRGARQASPARTLRRGGGGPRGARGSVLRARGAGAGADQHGHGCGNEIAASARGARSPPIRGPAQRTRTVGRGAAGALPRPARELATEAALRGRKSAGAAPRGALVRPRRQERCARGCDRRRASRGSVLRARGAAAGAG
jgi:hypothetical protein